MRMLLEGDCAEKMRDLADNSIDAIVTDPPYALTGSSGAGGFMGAKWDSALPTVDMWREALRVAKPGAHLLAFGGTRTYHRLACAIEDAGWEIRDCIMWVYGSGFPKSLDVAKAIDKSKGLKGEKIGERRFGKTSTGQASGWHVNHVAVTGKQDVFALATDEAKQWNGWGTCLKPACEPIVIARKPLEGTVAANVLKYGTGAINIDACRVPTETDEDLNGGAYRCKETHGRDDGWGMKQGGGGTYKQPLGRFPANLIHDGSDEVLALFPDSKGALAPVYGKQGNQKCHTGDNGIYGHYEQRDTPMFPRNDSGSAARFFYCAKASRSERGEGNVHPTVKPLALMRYLVRLVTRKGGIVLYEIASRRVSEANMQPLPPTTTQQELPL